MEIPSNRIKWRKLVKKLQRKRKRQKKAKERNMLEEKARQLQLNDPVHQKWLQQQAILEEFQKLEEQRQHDFEVEAWMRRELIAQQQFRLELERRKADDAAQEALRLEQEKELEEREAALKQKREEKERLAREAAEEFELMVQKMDTYLNDAGSETPQALKQCVQTRPGEKLCEFYERTNCCRFGLKCGFNHKRPLLSHIILIHHFFSHPLLQPLNHKEYATADSSLEFNERDLRDDYDNFFYDVVPELESFGKIINFRTIRNILPHLSGNVFVEYADKRSALKAFTKLQGRYYASKRLVVEFSNLFTWRGAVCGLSISRKCPRGNKCNYLHLFKNPDNKYNTALENKKANMTLKDTNAKEKMTEGTPSISWDDVCETDVSNSKRNWRWSESPGKEEHVESETATTSKNSSMDVKVTESERKHKKRRRSHKEKSKKSSKSDERGVRCSSKLKKGERERKKKRESSQSKYSEKEHRKHDKKHRRND